MGWIFAATLGLMVGVLFLDYLTLARLYLFKDIGSDTLNNFYTQRALVADLLRHGLPGWSFRQGMGQNVFPNLGDPFAWPLYLLGARALAYALAPLEAVKILVAGGLFYALLRLRNVHPFAAGVTALCYAFCGTIVIGGTWWYLLSNQVVHAALLLVGYELLLRGRHAWVFAAAVAAIAAFNPLEPYLLGVLLIGYALTRFAADRDPEPGAAAPVIGRVVLFGALGLAISAVFALPTALEMIQSPRVAGHSGLAAGLLHASPLGLGDARLYATEILRSFGNDLLGGADAYRGWQNYLEAPLHYCGLLTLLLAPQAWALALPRPRRVLGVVAALLALPFVFPWLRHAYWLFTGDYFRTLGLCVSVALLLASASALDAIARGRALHVPLLGGTLAVLVVLLLLPYAGLPAPGVDAAARGTAIAFLVVEAGSAWALARPGLGTLARVALIVIIPIELLATSYAPVNHRPAVTGAEWNDRVGYHDATLDALALVRARDHGFFRVEKSYASSPAADASLNDGKVQDYDGTSSYYSFNQLHYVGFLGTLGVIDPTDPVQTNWAPGLKSRFVLQTFASARYWLFRGDYRAVPMLAATYDSIGAAGDVTVLRNRAFVPLGFGLDRYVTARAFQALAPARKDVALLHAVVVPDGAAPPPGLAPFDTASTPTPYLLTTYVADAESCAAHALTIARLESNHIAGRAISATPREWVFSIPFDVGWSATVDGRPAPLAMIDAGMTGLALPAGAHDVRLDYDPPLRTLGAWISLVGLLGVAALAAGERRRRSRSTG